MGNSALIGSTGFVGGNLMAQFPFDEAFHRPNIAEITGKEFDLVVCAGAPAQKGLANANPDQDGSNLDDLCVHLETVRPSRFVLISTVDVFDDPREVAEYSLPNREGLHPYGLNRLKLEERVRNMFGNVFVIRLPGLFGPGLKKNFLFDMLSGQGSRFTNPRSVFQYYNVDRLWSDINIAIEAGLHLVHLVNEPIPCTEIAEVVFDEPLPTDNEVPRVLYDVQTVHAPVFGGTGDYVNRKGHVMNEIRDWSQQVLDGSKP